MRRGLEILSRKRLLEVSTQRHQGKVLYSITFTSLNRARIITNLDDLKDDDVEAEMAKEPLINKSTLQKSEVAKRKQELEDLLNDLNEESEEDKPYETKIHRRLNSEFSDVLSSTK